MTGFSHHIVAFTGDGFISAGIANIYWHTMPSTRQFSSLANYFSYLAGRDLATQLRCSAR